jgi:hypothetical protein
VSHQADVAITGQAGTHSTFISGMTASFLTAAIVAIAGALIALLTRKGHAAAH